MKGFTIFIQPDGDVGMHRVDTPSIQEAKAFAKWVNETTGAPVGIYDLRTFKLHSKYGDFGEGCVG